jgi:diguanylate cyclase (GGDEF)-like protein
VFNRRCFDERLAQEWGRAQRNNTALSVILIDIDFFKRYNDRYGHPAGDECLRRVAATLKAGLRRPGDLLARYGGEEFVCLLPLTPLEGGLHLAQTLGRKIAEQNLTHVDSSVAAVVTVSLGVCSINGTCERTPDELVRAADDQLYLAKSLGRGQACAVNLTENHA